MFGALYYPFCFSIVGYSAKKIKSGSQVKKKLIWIASMFTCLAFKGFLEFRIFILFKISFFSLKMFFIVVAHRAKDILALQPSALKIFLNYQISHAWAPSRSENSSTTGQHYNYSTVHSMLFICYYVQDGGQCKQRQLKLR